MPIQVLEDLENAHENYCREYLTLAFVDLDIPGNVIDVEDPVRFHIQISNSGPLTVKQLSLLVEGLNGTQVKSNGALSQWVASFTTTPGYIDDVKAHSSKDPVMTTGSKFQFKPMSASAAVKDLIKVSVAGWNTDFLHIQTTHTSEEPNAQVTYSSTVSPL